MHEAPRHRRQREYVRRQRYLVAFLAVVVVAVAAIVATGVGRGPSSGSAAGPTAAQLDDRIIDPGTAQLTTARPLPRVVVPPRSPARVTLGQPIRAGLAFDLATGRVQWARDATRVLPIASLTKLMTALIVVGRTGPRDVVRIPAAAPRVDGSRMGYLKAGRSVRVETLLHGLLMASGNDAAVALGDHVAGSQRAFARIMNATAQDLGLTCTHYTNAYGLGTGNRSCPQDLAQLAVRALAQPRIARIARLRSAKVRIGSIGRRWLATTNPLLRQGYPGTIGLKTGFTDPAGSCLIAAVRRGADVEVVIMLHAQNPAAAVERVLATVS